MARVQVHNRARSAVLGAEGLGTEPEEVFHREVFHREVIHRHAPPPRPDEARSAALDDDPQRGQLAAAEC
ncbi:MAG: hypothetical protein JWQ95_6295 [Sphaerisporangium sp.]|nr:hypothetical protein [Sphaerisporangium sp.]